MLSKKVNWPMGAISAASLFTTFTLMVVLKSVGAFSIQGIGSFIIAVAIISIAYGVTAALKGKRNTQAMKPVQASL
jgi:hypothetical protein